MALDPEDVIRKTFRPARLRGGYNEDDVDNFLDEVVNELVRLRTQVDELEERVAAPSIEQIETQRVGLEREQLDRIRAERQDLVAELAGLRQGLEHALRKKTLAEDRAAAADQAAAEAEQRQAEAVATEQDLQQRAARAQALHDDLTRVNEQLVGQLRSLRVAAETDAAELLGETPAEPPADATPADDLAAITASTRRVHEEHVRTGRDEAARLVEEATARAEQMVSEATERAEQMVSEATARAESLRSDAATETSRLVREAQAEHDRLLTFGREGHERLLATGQEEHDTLVRTGQQEHETLVRTGQEEHDRLVTQARTTSEHLVTEAEAQRAGILADLSARQAVLERRVEELDELQAGYRRRLRDALAEQLGVLDDEARWSRDPSITV